ncbi:glycosyltransferase family A protein [Planomicrobium sp. CPCC 101079]|uniref:glycosyltransferase family 2 protein n=1 Tax=Planomicrobium sp. CPCC 101079 TaxID=2599618 RepID=UPI0011B4595A|nr:glycosyltransferase family A protein [Planomicrobium sp. CPCC 101079]TWT03659.1 glycosyltransferase family 2 protein [Planomicrobium sp. CPCC 101079]
MVKVSVIVPTFNNTKENLERIIESFDNQTMDKKDFEVIFVDDGSSEFQSFKRLKKMADERPNYTVKSIKASGWGSKPRNMGTKIARGEYVFYSDDDDSIFPQALEKMYDFAKKHDFDVVNPKVIRTKGWSWGWDEYQENIIGAEKNGVQSMGPMTVPKLYKKSFLEKNGLTFSEGEKVWWEDVMFSCLVFSKNPHIGVLAEYPIYHWREQNRSASFGKDLDYKWSQLTNLAIFFGENLSQEDRDIMVGHWYKSRVLGAISKDFHKKKEEIQKIEFAKAEEWREKYVNDNVVSKLDSNGKVLDQILEMGRRDLAYSLSESRTGITARSYLKNASFVDDKILISCSADLTIDEEEAVKIKGRNRKIKIKLPKDVAKEIPKQLQYFDEKEIDESIYLPAIKGRHSRATWDVKTVKRSEFVYGKGLTGFTVTGELEFTINMKDYALDKADYFQPWDIATRFSYLDNFSQRALACKDDFKKAAIINNNTYVIYKNNSELFSIDMNSTVLNFLGVAKADVDNAYVENGKDIIVPIVNTYVYGDTNLEFIAAVIHEESTGFVDTTANIFTKNGSAYIRVITDGVNKGKNTIKIVLNNKAHEFAVHLD